MSIFSRFASVLSAGLLATSLFACAEPLQSGGVHFFNGARERFEAMCRFRRNAESGAESCAPPASDAVRAKVERLKSDEPIFVGSRLAAKTGDVLLTSGEISIIVGGPSSSRPGSILDVVDAHVGQDELESFTPCVAVTDGECLPLGAQTIGQEVDGRVWVNNVHVDPRGLSVTTRYTLIPGARSLIVSTVVKSSNAEPMSLSRLDDVIVWGAPQPVVPTTSPISIVAAVGSRVSYGLIPYPFGEGLDVETTESLMTVHHARNVSVDAAHEVRRDRVLVVAPRGDSLSVLTEVTFLRTEQSPGAIELRLLRPDGSPIPPPEGSRIRFVSQAFPIDAVWALGLPEEGMPLATEAPAGKYDLALDAAGRRAANVSVTVRPGEVTQATIVVEDSPPVVAPTP